LFGGFSRADWAQTVGFPTEQKSGPIAGATFQEVKVWKGSGQAMEVTVSRGGTALRELVTGKESEGHFFGFAASLMHL
jgi:hypothetical protein